jgi:hypothetical protein
MKLFELAATKPSKQAAKVFESYFGDSINVDVISPKQAQTMLTKVRRLVNEARRSTAFHSSEKNPTYLKLMMMERVLTAKLKEVSTVAVGSTAGANANQAQSTQGMPPVNPTVAVGDADKIKQMQQQKVNAIKDPRLKQALEKATKGQNLTPQDQQLVAGAALQTESRSFRHQLYTILRESEVAQAQVILAAQDMVDKIQKMLEDTTAMQFKDLPALVDQVKSQVGIDQAMQFNTDATGALSGLVQNLQTAKQSMDAALATVTGQAQPTAPAPGAEVGAADMGAVPDMGGADMGAAGGEPDLGGLDDMGGEEVAPDMGAGAADLGRAKR